jgi:DNA-binding transcriptional LysR family regulator
MDMRYRAARATATVAAMELRHLRYFVAVAEELHFRRAAERLHIAQPAVSEQIRNLERELGVRLLERTQRSVALTAPGAALLVEARRVLRLADDAKRVTRQAEAGVTARLRIARPPDVLPAIVPRAMRRFAAARPHVDVCVELSEPRAAIEGVRGDLLDVAVACLPAPVAGLTVTPIAEDGVVVALPDTHPGTGQRAFPIEQLDGIAPIMLAREANPPFYDGVLAAARDASVTLHDTRATAPSVEHALLTVVTGRVPALLPSSVAERHMLRGVCILPLAEPVPSSVVALVSRPDSQSPHALEFIRLAATLAHYGRPTPVLERVA